MITLKVMRSPTIREQLVIDTILQTASERNILNEVQTEARIILKNFPDINIITAYIVALNYCMNMPKQ
jgi:hypothetical protein